MTPNKRQLAARGIIIWTAIQCTKFLVQRDELYGVSFDHVVIIQ